MKKKDEMKWRIYVESIRYLEPKKHPEWGSILRNTKIGPVLDVKVCLHQRYGIEIMVETCFETEQFLGFELWMELTHT